MTFRARSSVPIRAVLLLAITALAFSLLATAPTKAHAAQTYWVAPQSMGGNNNNPGTQARPFRGLGYAFKKLRPGDTLWVKGSATRPYIENVGIPHPSGDGKQTAGYYPGTATNPIKVYAAPGHQPWIHGILHVRGANYWRFRGINVRRNRDSAKANHEMLVKFMDGIGWRYTNAEIKGASSYANLYIGNDFRAGPRSWQVTGNCIHDNSGDPSHQSGRDHNVYVAAGLGNRSGLIARNLIFNAPKGHNVKVGVGGSSGDGTSYVRLEYNTIYNGLHNVIVTGKSNHTVMQRNLLGRVGTRVSGVRQQEWYPNLRGYELSGGSNVAKYNYGFQSPRIIDGGGIRNGGGNRLSTTPRFNNVKNCRGFHTPTRMAYGRYA